MIRTITPSEAGNNYPRCLTCKHWARGWLNTGLCDKLPDFQKMDIIIEGGGLVDSVETEEDFGCTLHESYI